MSNPPQMIAANLDFNGAPLLRREFVLEKGHGEVVSAVLKVSALGIVHAYLNGREVTDALLTPGWSSYEWRLRYLEIDATEYIENINVLGLALGNGWYRGYLTWMETNAIYGDELAGYAELKIVFADGFEQSVVSDERWESGPSAVLANDLYGGQTIDARLWNKKWLQPAFKSRDWTGVHSVDFDDSVLTSYIGPTVTAQETLKPQQIWKSPSGRTLVDFGQNLVGWIRVTVKGSAGDEVVLRHAEVIENGELGTRPLRTAKAEDRYFLSGNEDVFEPTFTLHGFRFAEVEGWPGELQRDQLEAVVVSSDMQRIGIFECSNPLLNKLHENVVWSTRANFVDIPTDCPQRDERLGWTGDISVFAPTAAYLFDVDGLLRDWLRDLAAEQAARGGMVACVVPDVLKFVDGVDEKQTSESTAIWSDAAVWVPWALWEAYGDKTVLEVQFDSMVAHIDHVSELLSETGLWDQGYQFGDWLDPDAAPDAPDDAKADAGVVATACFYRSVAMATKAARILGRSELKRFASLENMLRVAFNDHYVKNGRIFSDAATAYALAIVFGLLDEQTQKSAGERLSELVKEASYRVSTGFAGTPFITDALTKTGHINDAYRLLLEQECPSWLYPVTMGATTIWERWDSMLPDGSINPGTMTSFNHYALGAVADWMHRTIGGIAPLEPGYKRILFAPKPGGGLTWAKTSLITPQGLASIKWVCDGGELRLDVTVPEGTSAVLRVGSFDDVDICSGKYHFCYPVFRMENCSLI